MAFWVRVGSQLLPAQPGEPLLECLRRAGLAPEAPCGGRLIYHDFNYKPEEVQAVRNEAIRLVGDTNGSLNLDCIDSV